MLGILIVSIINLIGISVLVYRLHRFIELSTEVFNSTENYILKLYNVVDKNFKKEAEILNTITEWRNKHG